MRRRRIEIASARLDCNKNAILRTYNGLGQLVAEAQEHSGAVTGSSASVGYAYSEMAGGANHSRPTSVTYPSGYVTDAYSSGLNSGISRRSSLADTTGTLEGYEFLGVGTVVVRDHPQPEVVLTYVTQGAEGNGAAGDQYRGLDAFGRVIDQRWIDTGTGTALDRFEYGYDRGGNRTYRDNRVSTGFGEVYTYDGLNQLASFDRGTLNGTKDGITGTVARSQDWDYDALGNWESLATDGGSAVTRTHNRQNEVTAVGGSSLAFDTNGNLTTDESGRTLVYDAWNRLVAVKSGATTLVAYAYDGLGRRVSEAAGGTTTDLYYSSQWQVLEERVGGAATARHVWSPAYVDAMVLRDRDTDANGSLDERLWPQQDANWNVTSLADGTGAVVERYAYDPFGAVTVLDAGWGADADGVSDVGWTQLWQGMFYDSLSASYKSRGRTDISPTLGRPFQVDPVGLGPDVNPYRWEGNGPTGWVDPSGLATCDDVAGGKVVYYKNVGWVDWNHASSYPTKTIIDSIKEGLKQPGITKFVPLYAATDGPPNAPPLLWTGQGYVNITIGNPGSPYPGKNYAISKNIPPNEFFSVMLAIYMDYQLFFEQMQQDTKFLHGHNSGFSQEDLMSDLIGFYRYMADPDGTKFKTDDDVADYFGLGEKLSTEEAVCLCKSLGGDLGLPANKNKYFVPVNHNNSTTKFKGKPMLHPLKLQTITPSGRGLYWWTPVEERLRR